MTLSAKHLGLTTLRYAKKIIKLLSEGKPKTPTDEKPKLRTSKPSVCVVMRVNQLLIKGGMELPVV